MTKTLLVGLAMALVPACAFAVDGVTLINMSTVTAAGGFPYKITQPGSYKLTGNLTVPDADTTAILVTAANVTIDLNGFSIIGPTVCVGSPAFTCSPTGAGFGVNGGFQDSITVINGSVRGMGFLGIDLRGNGGYVEKVHADSNGAEGIRANTATVKGNTATFNGGTGIVAIESTVKDNTAKFNHSFGIEIICPSSVVGNTATNNAAGNLHTSGLSCALENNAAP